MTGEHEATTFATPSEREIVITRVFDAPRALVWEALTSPAHLRRWLLGPDGWTMYTCEVDLRPGGAWRYGWRHDGGGEMEMSGVYQQVVAPERIVTTESWGDDWPATLNTTVLAEDADGGSTTITQTIVFPSRAARDAALATGMRDGIAASFRRLERELAAAAAPNGWSLEVIVLPVTDVERAKRFYDEQAGFVVDHDLSVGGGMRVIQLTPPGSACSIVIGPLVVEEPPRSSARLQLVVPDVEAARAALAGRGVAVSEVQHFEAGGRAPGHGGDWNAFVFFDDPDGNGWTVQERAPAR